mgnify:CR=1 FL=1
MSRIGKKPVQIPAGVDVAVDGSHVTVKGPKGQLELDIYNKLEVSVEEGVLTVSRPDDERETRARHGLTRALIQNMVTGVSEGYTKALELAASATVSSSRARRSSFRSVIRTPSSTTRLTASPSRCPTTRTST